jgi:hypothetical protein
VARYEEGRGSLSNRIIASEELCHLLSAVDSARRNRMSRGHVCVAICDHAAYVRPNTLGVGAFATAVRRNASITFALSVGEICQSDLSVSL